jgi:acyl-CoA thioesterase FadM
VTFHEGAVFGDHLDIRTKYVIEGPYRVLAHQSAWKQGASKPCVSGIVELVIIDEQKQLQPIPEFVATSIMAT